MRLPETRRGVLKAFSAGIAGVAGCLGPPGERSLDHEWPMFRYDPARTGAIDGVSGPRSVPGEQWSTEMGPVWGSPVVADGTLFVGSYDSKLHALDAITGERLWEYEIGATTDATPAVYDGTVYIGAFDRTIHAVDAETGDGIWRLETGGYIRSSPTVVDDTLYIGGNCRILECASQHELPEQEHGDVFALDPDTGAVQWHYEPEKDVISSPAVVGDTLYVGSRNGVVHALDAADGEPEWTYETARLLVSTPAVSNGSVFIGDWGGNVYGIDATTGEERWVVSTDAQYISGSPAVRDGTVYIGVAAVPEPNPEGAEKPYESRGELLAIGAETGDRLWTYRAETIEIGSSPP